MSLREIWYATTAIAMGGHTSFASMSEGPLTVPLSVPVEMGGDGGPGTNPEQLFALGFASSFLAAMTAISLRRAIALSDEVSVVAEVGVGPAERGLGFKVCLHVSLPGLEKPVAEALIRTAQSFCPYSNGTRLNVDVDVVLA
ncbi:Ohr family peroxiredoxin [Roseateles aquatilis]|nr:Ohr family peroxiredoxin [Roseateles aquatilis]